MPIATATMAIIRLALLSGWASFLMAIEADIIEIVPSIIEGKHPQIVIMLANKDSRLNIKIGVLMVFPL